MHPICLPNWKIHDIEGKPINKKLYKPIEWENYQRLYSLKALHREQRFTHAWTDVNGPTKYLVRISLSNFQF